MTIREGYDPRQDPDYQAYRKSLTAQEPPQQDEPEYSPPTAYGKSRPNKPTAATSHYRPSGAQANQPQQTTDKNGTGWDRTVQQGEVIRTFQRSYKGRDGKLWYNGQLRLIRKEFKGNPFVSLENWKVHVDDAKRDANVQKHEWKGASNIQVKELREVGQAMIDLAEQMDGGSV